MDETELLVEIAVSVAIIAASGIIGEALSRVIRTVMRRAGARPVTIRGVRDGLRIFWIAIAVSGVVWATHLASLLTVLTISGIAGLVVSLSLQAMFSNIISGILLVQDGAIRIGDEIEYSGVRGKVIRVALRNTWVMTPEGHIAIIGNSALTNGPLINRTASGRMADQFLGD
jgi:small conductance mechanosensitive channel